MQQRLAVASVLVLALMAGASVLLIQSHASGQSPASASQTPRTPSISANSSIPTTTGGSLLTSPNPQGSGGGDDGGDHWGTACGTPTSNSTMTETISTTTTTSTTATCGTSTFTADE